MGTIDQKSEPQSVAATAARPPISYQFDQELGLSSFKNQILEVLRDRERTHSKEEIKFVLDSCQRLNQQIYKELKTRMPDDPSAEQMKDLRSIVSDLSEYLALKTEFSDSLQKHDAGDEAALRGSPRIFVQMGITDVSQKLEDTLKRLDSIQIQDKPFLEKIKRLSAVVLASLSLLSMRGTHEDPEAKILENRPTTELNKTNEIDQTKTTPSQKELAKNPKVGESETRSGASFDNGQVVNNKTPGKTLNPDINAPSSRGDSFKDIQIDFPLLSSVSDPLWVSKIYCRNERGDFDSINRQTEIIGSSPEASCVEKLNSVQAGEKINLSSPFGFGIGNIEVSKKDGTPVTFTWDQNKNEITIGQLGIEVQKTISVEVKYEILEGREKLGMPEPTSVEMARSEYQRALIEALKADPSRVEEVLDLLFSKYTYLTSSNINGIIAKFPIQNHEEIYGNIGIGDCDSVSIVGAGLLNEAGIKAGIICGHNEESGSLGAAHAKLVYEDQNGEFQTYESTQKMKNAFFNLALEPDDYRMLTHIVDKMRAFDTVERKMSDYKEFKEALESILQKPYYDFYKKSPERAAGSSRNLLTNLDELRESLPRGKKELLDFGALATGLMALVGSGYLLGRAASSAYRKNAVANLSKNVENPGQTPDSHVSFGRKIENLQKSLGLWIEDSKRSFEDIPEIGNLIDKFSDASLEQQQALMKYILIMKVISGASSYHKINSPTVMRYSFALKERIEQQDRNVLGINEAFKIALRETADKKSLAHFREKLPQIVSDIMTEAIENNRNYMEVPKSSRPTHQGTKETSSRVRSQSRTDDFIGHREYSQGDTLQSIDWRVTARSGDGKIWVKEYSMPRFESKDRRAPVSVVVDISTIRTGELSDFATFLLQADSPSRIESVTVCAFGEVVQRIDGRVVSSKLQGPKNIEAVENLIRSLLEKKNEINPTVQYDFGRYVEIHDTLTQCSDIFFPIHLISSERKTIVFGNNLVGV